MTGVKLKACLAALAALAVIASCLLASCHPCARAVKAPSADTDELLVRFQPGVGPERVARIAAELGLEGRETPVAGYHLFRAAGPHAMQEALERLKALPEVERAQPNYRYRPAR